MEAIDIHAQESLGDPGSTGTHPFGNSSGSAQLAKSSLRIYAVELPAPAGSTSDDVDAGSSRWRLYVPRCPFYLDQPGWAKISYEMGKRALDVSLSLVGILLALPLLALLALLIKLTSPGPVLFRHRRLGLRGKEFWCLKLRTMVPDAEERLREDSLFRSEFEREFKLRDDPRVTPLGALLRATSLDELPQLFNILKGDMTFIGPRPIVRPELAKYGEWGVKLLTVKPGLTGLWQSCGRSDTTYVERVEMDMAYIDHRCPLLDLRILLMTAGAVLRKRGSC